MEIVSNNILDVELLVQQFLKTNNQGIHNIYNLFLKNSDILPFNSFIIEIVEELKKESLIFLSKKDSNIEDLNHYLLYIVNDFCKNKAIPKIKKKVNYICPGCSFLGKENLVNINNKHFQCKFCEKELIHINDPKQILFFKTFIKYNKVGYHCNDCTRFIPHPINEDIIVVCPYFDCCFVGPRSSLKRMHHPKVLSNTNSNLSINHISVSNISLENKEKLNAKISLIKEIIDSQYSNVNYNSSDFTIHHKCLSYKAFGILLDRYPEDMVNYLLNNSRSGGFQHKVFQEYINLLEDSFPYTYKKGGKIYIVKSLLDENLNLFEGISTFESKISDKLNIKNETKEFYIGGRKGSISRPYYIGKLLSVTDKNTKTPLIEKVSNYSFSKINMKDINPGTNVIVSHLRIPPHYQMGGMVYINRIRKNIIDCAKFKN